MGRFLKMKRRIISIIALVIVSYSLSWALDKPLIDPEFKKVDEEIRTETKECMSKPEKSAADNLNAEKKYENKYEQEGKIRGTEEYCETNYSD